MAPPFQTVTFDILYSLGISKVGELIDLGVSQKILRNQVLGSMVQKLGQAKIK